MSRPAQALLLTLSRRKNTLETINKAKGMMKAVDMAEEGLDQ